MDLIEPNHFDAVVVTSGLPEVLIASALARAGKSVLVLDAAESYGGSWSSLSGPDYVHQLINRQLEHQARVTQQHQPGSEPSTEAEAVAAAAGGAADYAATLVALQPVTPLSGASGVALRTHAQLQEALSARGLIIELSPKVLYQDEPLVQLLVSCQAHNYLEFKLIEGSYLYHNGRLARVAASRADLFSDKSLPLADKRSLGRFLTGCLQAQQGFGRLKDAFNEQPLLQLLQAEGLSQQLQDTVLYGIAMADLPQQQQQQQQQPDPLQQQRQQQQLGTDKSNVDITGNSSSISRRGCSRLLTAAEGLAALQLYSCSLGRYGGSGAFMAPCYGCGSLPEAFVRLAAVKGAVTALRHGAQLLLLPPGQATAAAAAAVALEGVPAAVEEAAAADGSHAAAIAAAADSAESAAEAGASAAGRVKVVLASGQQLTAHTVVSCQTSRAPSSSSSSSTSAAAPAAPPVVVARAVAVVNGSVVDDEGSLLLVFPPGSLADSQAAVIRGLQLGPSLAVTPPGNFLLYLSAVLTPELLEGYNGGKRAAAAAGLGVAADNGSSDGLTVAEQVLGPALGAIVSLEQLSAVKFGGAGSDEQAANSDSGGAAAAGGDELSSAADTAAADDAASTAADTAAADDAASAAAAAQQQQRPQVLAVCYFLMHQQGEQQWSTVAPQQQPQHHQQQEVEQERHHHHQQQQQEEEVQQPDNAVLWCPAAPPGLTGYSQVVQRTEALFRQHFPQLPWLTDEIPQTKAGEAAAAAAAADQAGGAAGKGGGSEGVAQPAGSSANGSSTAGGGGAQPRHGGGGAGVLDDDELDAIDELTAALRELSQPQAEPAGGGE